MVTCTLCFEPVSFKNAKKHKLRRCRVVQQQQEEAKRKEVLRTYYRQGGLTIDQAVDLSYYQQQKQAKAHRRDRRVMRNNMPKDQPRMRHLGPPGVYLGAPGAYPLFPQ